MRERPDEPATCQLSELSQLLATAYLRHDLDQYAKRPFGEDLRPRDSEQLSGYQPPVER
jgi:hypothetical protein